MVRESARGFSYAAGPFHPGGLAALAPIPTFRPCCSCAYSCFALALVACFALLRPGAAGLDRVAHESVGTTPKACRTLLWQSIIFTSTIGYQAPWVALAFLELCFSFALPLLRLCFSFASPLLYVCFSFALALLSLCFGFALAVL